MRQSWQKKKPLTIDEVENYDETIEDAVKLPKLKVVSTWNTLTGPQGQKGIDAASGTKFDSKWEYAYYRYNRAKGIMVERNWKEQLPYIDENGKQRMFHPDFVSPIDGLVEIKGILRPTDAAKMAAHPEVKFLFGEDIKPMMEWLNKNEPNWLKDYLPRLD